MAGGKPVPTITVIKDLGDDEYDVVKINARNPELLEQWREQGYELADPEDLEEEVDEVDDDEDDDDEDEE